jgi:hypothetical protein
VCAKILEFVLGRSTPTNSFDWQGIVVRKLYYILLLPEYWTLVLRHAEMHSSIRIKAFLALPTANYNSLISNKIFTV